ncbi:MAG TPA: hypothetical protein VL326_34000, partial [Kofleriaceae bacterium]|nr:hypothetical protein [Kofleriaceae bacterium]
SQKLMPPDELAARRNERADSTLSDPPLAAPPPEHFGAKAEPDRESAPGLPSPPEPTRPRMLDQTPPRTTQPSQPPVNEAKTKLGMEPAKVATSSTPQRPYSSSNLAEMSAAPRAAIANEPSRPLAPKRPSSAPIILAILFVVAGAIAALWFVFLKEKGTTTAGGNDKGSGGAVIPDKGSSGSANVVDNGSAGSAVAMTGSDTGSAGSAGTMTGSAGSAAVAMTGSAMGKPVDTVIAASVAKGAIVEIEGTELKGPAPFTTKLEKDQVYKAKVSAPGFVAQEIEVKGGGPKVTAKLVAKARVISVSSDPAGADILIDGAPTSKLAPADVTLTAAQAARPRIRVTLRRPGFKPLDQIVDAAKWTEGDDKMTATVTGKLVVAPKINPNGGGGNNTGGGNTNTGTGSGSATTPTGTGSGSATTPTGGGTTTPPTGGGTGSASGGTTTPPSGGTTTPPAGGTTTPPSGGTLSPPAGGTTGTTSGSSQTLK